VETAPLGRPGTPQEILQRSTVPVLCYHQVREQTAADSRNLIYRWVQRFTPELIDAARPSRHVAGDRWFVDETYLKVAGRWVYLLSAFR
jgi:transposase-like protein